MIKYTKQDIIKLYNIGILELVYTNSILSIKGYSYDNKQKEFIYDVSINGGLYKMNESAIEQLELLQQVVPFKIH